MKNRNIKERNFKGLILGSKGTLIALCALLGLSGCSKNKKESSNDITTTPTIAVESVSKDENVTTPIVTPEVTPEVTPTITPEVITGLNTLDNESIEVAVESSYEKYEKYYETHGMSKDQIRDMIFILNDKYVDEDGNLIVDVDRVNEAYSNIEKIMYSDDIIQKMDNINAIEGNIELKNDFVIVEHPSLVDFIDQNKTGGKYTAEKVAEYEKIRNKEIEVMNTTGNYDRELVNNYIKKILVTDINSNQDHMDNMTKNGQKYVVAATKNYALQFAAVMNNQKEFLEINEDGVNAIKINPTKGERYLENTVLRLLEEGLLDEETFDNIVKYVKVQDKIGNNVDNKEVSQKYDVALEETNIVVSYAKYLTSMANTSFFDVMCDEEAESVDEVNNLINAKGMNNNKYLKYTK